MPKEYDYLLCLKKPDVVLIDRFSRLMLLVALASFAFTGYAYLSGNTAGFPKSFALLLLAIFLIVLAWWLYTERRWHLTKERMFRPALMLVAWGWFIVPDGKWVSSIYIIASLLEKPAKVPPEVGFDAEGATMNSFPKKHYPWSKLANVVLRDGLLSIDLKDNQLIQKDLDGNVEKALENEFNAFCADQLNKSRSADPSPTS